MSGDPGDAALVLAARAGDRAAFATLIERHRPVLVASRVPSRPRGWVMRRMAGDVAEEAAQEAAIQAMLGLDRLRDPERFGAWLVGIGLNVCRHLLRRRPAVPWQPEAPADPQELAEAAELVAAVRRAVAALPCGQREAVTLFYLEGLSQRDVAAALGIGVNAVKGRLHKARRRLRTRLVEYEYEEEAVAMTIEMRVEDVVRGKVDGVDEPGNVVRLREVGGDRSLGIWVGPFEANCLAVQLEDLEMVRPLTYTLAARLLEATGGTLEEVRISRLAEKTFYAEAVVRTAGGATHAIDARPSDALNLAVLLGRPVRVAPEVLEAAAGDSKEPQTDVQHAADIVNELLARPNRSGRPVGRRVDE